MHPKPKKEAEALPVAVAKSVPKPKSAALPVPVPKSMPKPKSAVVQAVVHHVTADELYQRTNPAKMSYTDSKGNKWQRTFGWRRVNHTAFVKPRKSAAEKLWNRSRRWQGRWLDKAWRDLRPWEKTRWRKSQTEEDIKSVLTPPTATIDTYRLGREWGPNESLGFRLSSSPVASPRRPTPRPNPTWKERQSRQCRENGGTGDRGRSGSAGRSATAAKPGCPSKKRVRPSPLTPIRKPYRYQVSPPSTPPSRNNADSLSPSRSSSSSTLSWCGGITCNHAACSRHAVCQGAALDAQLTKEEMSWE